MISLRTKAKLYLAAIAAIVIGFSIAPLPSEAKRAVNSGAEPVPSTPE